MTFSLVMLLTVELQIIVNTNKTLCPNFIKSPAAIKNTS